MPVTHCKHDHEFTPENTNIRANGTRACRACMDRRTREHRQRKLANRPPRQRDYEVPCSADLAWAAGLFEGEGTCTLTKGGSAGYTRDLVTVTSTDREIVDFFHSRWGGALRIRSLGGNARDAWVWEAKGYRANFFCEDLLPHLRTSRVRARMELLRRAHAARRQGGIRSAAYLMEHAALLAEMRRLNHRGRHDDGPDNSAGT